MARRHSIAAAFTAAIVIVALIALSLPQIFANAAGPVFYAPLNDAGNGAVNTTPATGSGAAAFTRATPASTYLSDGMLKTDVASGVARSAYAPNSGSYLGYLAEGTRTNQTKLSENIGDTTDIAWNTPAYTYLTLTANATVAPDGALTGDKFADTADDACHEVQLLQLNFPSGVNVTVSIFAKPNTLNKHVDYAFQAGVPTTYFHSGKYELSGAGSIMGSGGTNGAAEGWSFTQEKIIQSDANWYRSEFTGMAGPGYWIAQARYRTVSSVGDQCYPGDGSSLYFWGSQTEEGAFASSYIKNTSSTANATRDMDVLQYQVGGNIASNDETIYLEWAPVSIPSPMGTVFLWGSYVDTNNYTAILHDGTNLIARKRIAGVNYDAVKALSYFALTKYKIAARFSSLSGIDIFVNGSKGTNNSNTSGLALGANFQIGADGNSANSGWGNFANIVTYGEGLSDTQLRTIGSGCVPPAQSSGGIQVSICNNGSITNSTTAYSSTGSNTAGGSVGGRGGRGGDISAGSGGGNNGGAGTGSGGDGGNGGAGGFIETGNAFSSASTTNDANNTDIDIEISTTTSSTPVAITIDNQSTDCDCDNVINNKTRSRARTGGNLAGGSTGGAGGGGGDIAAGSGNDNNGGAGTGGGGSGGTGSVGGAVATGNASSTSATSNLVNTTLVRLRL